MSNIINITKSAEEYLSKLLKDKNDPDLSIRIFVNDPGTPKAETCLAYCKPEEAHKEAGGSSYCWKRLLLLLQCLCQYQKFCIHL